MMIKKTTNKYTSFLLAIFFVAIISVALIIVIMDSDNEKLASESELNYTEAYAELKHTVNKLNSSLTSLTSDIKKAKEEAKKQAALIEQIKNGVASKEDMENANVQFDQKYIELLSILPDFEKKLDDKGFDIDEFIVYDEDYFVETRKLQADAIVRLERSLSVKEQDEIIAGFRKTIEEWPTRVQKLYAALEELEKDGANVSEAERKLIVEVNRLLTFVPSGYSEYQVNALFATGEKKAIVERINAYYIEYAPVLAADFIKKVEAIEKYTNINDAEDIKIAREAYDYFKGFFAGLTDEDVVKAYKKVTNIRTDYYKSLTALLDHEDRIAVLLEAEKAAEIINDRISKYDDSKIDSSTVTYAELVDFTDTINAWIATYAIVSDAEDEAYVADNYNLINHSVLDGYYNKFTSIASDLIKQVETIISTVKALPNDILPSSKADIDEVTKAWKTFWDKTLAIKTLKINNRPDSKKTDWTYNDTYDKALTEIDAILGYVGDKADEGLVAALEATRSAEADYKYLENEIAKLGAFVTSLYKGDYNKGSYLISVIRANEAMFDHYDLVIYELLVEWELSEEDIGEDMLAAYKLARNAAAYEDTLAQIDAILATYEGLVTEPQAKKVVKELKAELLEIFEEYYIFDPATAKINGIWQYVGEGVWTDGETNKFELNLAKFLEKLDAESESYAFKDIKAPEFTN